MAVVAPVLPLPAVESAAEHGIVRGVPPNFCRICAKTGLGPQSPSARRSSHRLYETIGRQYPEILPSDESAVR